MNPPEQLYDEWHKTMASAGADDVAGPWHLMAGAHLGDLTGQRVLEIGCGRGGFSQIIHDHGADLVAADFSPSAVEIAKGVLAGRAGCEVRVADIQAIPFEDNSFKTVVSLETLEHVPDPGKGLAELVRVTEPSGRLIITTPNYYGGMGLYRRYRELTGRTFTEVGQPINQPIKLKDRVKQLKALGCRLDVVDGCGHYLYIPRRYPIRLRWMDHPRLLMKWFAAHSLTVATKLGG